MHILSSIQKATQSIDQLTISWSPQACRVPLPEPKISYSWSRYELVLYLLQTQYYTDATSLLERLISFIIHYNILHGVHTPNADTTPECCSLIPTQEFLMFWTMLFHPLSKSIRANSILNGHENGFTYIHTSKKNPPKKPLLCFQHQKLWFLFSSFLFPCPMIAHHPLIIYIQLYLPSKHPFLYLQQTLL